MNSFEQSIMEQRKENALYCDSLSILQVNVGLKCNLTCAHCHLEASPERTELMSWPVMEKVIDIAGDDRFGLVDITGGSPELNPNLPRFVEALHNQGIPVQVRTNLTVLTEPDLDHMPEFYRDHGVTLVASMPCYIEENVAAQRGEGVYDNNIAVLKILNSLGYGIDPALELDLVYNPGGPALPGPQQALEEAYRKEFGERFGIRFTRLLTITNMPIGRFFSALHQDGSDMDYMRLLKESFNPDTVSEVMCRHQLSVGWDGSLYDCDFNMALGLTVNHGAPDHIDRYDPDSLATRRIVTGEHCFGCTAGAGSSCGGALL